MRMLRIFLVSAGVAALAVIDLLWRPYPVSSGLGGNGNGGFPSFAPMLARAMPAIVSIRVSATRIKPVQLGTVASDSVPKEPTVDAVAEEVTEARGSGSIVDARRGLIYTNQHVVTNASEVTVMLADGREINGRVLGSDIGADIAVVQIEADNLKAVPLANSDKLRVGDLVVIAGSPYGLAGTTKLGMVSALMRSDVAPEIFEDFVQVDAIINPGISGGAMLNTRGELSGVVAASIGSAGETGIGFVIPINMARSIADQIVAGGMVRRGAIGFGVQPLKPEFVNSLKLPFARGAVIMAVAPNSPAARTNFKQWDVIVSVDNRAVQGASDFAARIASIPIGKPVTLGIYSKGRVRKAKLIVADLNVTPDPMPAPESLKALEGLTLGRLLPGSEDYGKVKGARVLAVAENTVAARLGFSANDVITKIDGNAVAAPEDAFALAQAKTAQFRIDVSRRGRPAYVDITP